MIHYPDSIRQLGNLVDYSTLRFEAKHSFVKSSAHTIHNCNNILFSVLKKHQIFSFYNLESNSLINIEFEIKKSFEIEQRDILDDLLIGYINEKKIVNANIKTDLIVTIFNQIFKSKMNIIYQKKNNKDIKIGEIVKIFL